MTAYTMTSPISASDLARVLGLEIQGNNTQKIIRIATLSDLEVQVLRFSNKLVTEDIAGVTIGPIGSQCETLLVSENPRLDFCRALAYLIDAGYLRDCDDSPDISNTAIIANSAVIENGVKIGDNSIVEHNAVIHRNTQIGKNCIIRANTVVGAQGFGFEQDSNTGEWTRFPHLGRVIINDNVEIGALNSICVGAIEDTIIDNGVKTDNLVHIAHNCSIGANSILTACAELSGGVSLGAGVWVGPNASIMQKVTIGDNAMVGLGTVVTKNVEDGNVVAGVPAKVVNRRYK